jgi:hypothetical protein
MTIPAESVRAMFRARDAYVALALAEERAYVALESARATHERRPTPASARRLASAAERHAHATAKYDAAHAAQSIQP